MDSAVSVSMRPSVSHHLLSSSVLKYSCHFWSMIFLYPMRSLRQFPHVPVQRRSKLLHLIRAYGFFSNPCKNSGFTLFLMSFTTVSIDRVYQMRAYFSSFYFTSFITNDTTPVTKAIATIGIHPVRVMVGTSSSATFTRRSETQNDMSPRVMSFKGKVTIRRIVPRRRFTMARTIANMSALV
jgi:hypothetical protein